MVLVGFIRRKDTEKSPSSFVVEKKKSSPENDRRRALHYCSARLRLQINRLFFKVCCYSQSARSENSSRLS